jgi:hypothetical protein
MVCLNLTEQELFDLIMTLHTAESASSPEETAEEAKRRKALLEKLHAAFEPLFAR